MYREGDWVVEIATGRVGYVVKKYWCEVMVKFGRKTEIVYPEMMELAPMELQQEDLLEMQRLAVDTGDKEWFYSLSQRLGEAVHG
jgi:uncharacterized protein YpiB (UPF0302 family)